MRWCNTDSDHEERENELITPSITPKLDNNKTDVTDHDEIQTIKCPSCGHNIEIKDQVLIQIFFLFFLF